MTQPRPLQDRFATLARITVDGVLRRCVVLRNDGRLAYVRLISTSRYIACSHSDLLEWS